ncbi:hypothetical protein V5E97_36535 [Singulisphaera sp. Ch08]|uniref:Uncharacterized protein n=1 Tax=Singulisphaera sp. Ch08 TaxID=3120278 RepID=A0AAU7CE21_9BACT
MTDPAELLGASPPRLKASAQTGARPGVVGCLAGLIGFVIFGFVMFGIGRPHGYCYRIGPMQIFESAEGVSVFVAIDLVTSRPGLVRSPPVVRNPVRLYRIDVGRDGTVTRLILKPPAGKSHLLSIEPVVKLPEGLYLLQTPSLGHPFPQLHRIHGERIEPLSVQESGSVLRSLGYAGGDFQATRLVTERNGWQLLDRLGSTFRRFPKQVISHRHQFRLRFMEDDTADSITAESFGEGERWAVPLLTIKTRQWRSYRSPPHLE